MLVISTKQQFLELLQDLRDVSSEYRVSIKASFLNTDLSDTELDDIDFSESEFVGVNFHHNIIKDCSFNHCKLDTCNLSDSNISVTTFHHALLINTNFHASLLIATDFKSAYLNSCDLSLVAGAYQKWKHTRFAHCDLSDSTFRRANFTSAKFNSDTKFNNTSISQSKFTDAYLDYVDLSNLHDFAGVIGEGKRFLTFRATPWHIVILRKEQIMQIGCQKHTLDEWFGFSVREIDDMSTEAVDFWEYWKPILKLLATDSNYFPII